MAYAVEMGFEWGEAKNGACFEYRGFDFAYAVRTVLDPHRFVAQDRRGNYGEDRYRLLGMIDGRCMSSAIRCAVWLFASLRPARPTGRRLRTMSTTRVRIDPNDPSTLPSGRNDLARVDATTEAEIASQQQEDEEKPMQDLAGDTRRIRRRLGLSQTELARCIDVPRETIRNWKQGKRCRTGAARAIAGARQGAGNRAARLDLKVFRIAVRYCAPTEPVPVLNGVLRFVTGAPGHDHGDQPDGVLPCNDCPADRAGDLYQYMSIIIQWRKS